MLDKHSIEKAMGNVATTVTVNTTTQAMQTMRVVASQVLAITQLSGLLCTS